MYRELVLLVKFVPESGQNHERCQSILRHVKKSEKTHEKSSKDNVVRRSYPSSRQHHTTHGTDLPISFRWEIYSLTYLPELTPSDFCLHLTTPKEFSDGRRFPRRRRGRADGKEVAEGVGARRGIQNQGPPTTRMHRTRRRLLMAEKREFF